MLSIDWSLRHGARVMSYNVNLSFHVKKYSQNIHSATEVGLPPVGLLIVVAIFRIDGGDLRNC